MPNQFSYVALLQIILIAICTWVIVKAIWEIFINPKKEKPKVTISNYLVRLSDSKTKNILSIFYFHNLKTTKIMQQVTFMDVQAAGKFVDVIYQLTQNAAGNFPTFKSPVQASSTNELVATAEVGPENNPDQGTYHLRIKYTGKVGSADCKLVGDPDWDNSGDGPVEAVVTSVIHTDEISSFGTGSISELKSE